MKGIVLGALAFIVVACGGVGPPPSPSPAPTNGPTPTPLPTPSPSDAPSGFYLRAWYAQALPPVHTFNWLPVLTIADGMGIDGNVAVPAIFPGPLVIMPNARAISDAGTAALASEARELGLLGEKTDFTDGNIAPGSRTGNIHMVVDGVTYDLVGNPDAAVGCQGVRCIADPGTPEAFGAFWNGISNLDALMAGELGPPQPFEPDRVAVLFTEPAAAEPGLEQQLATWPLDGTFLDIGVEFPGEAGARCVTLAGEDLATVLPVLQAANQLSVFHDEVDATRSAVVAVLSPGQASPCPDAPVTP